MATITYTATLPDGGTATRSSGTMFYTHYSVVRGSWHKSLGAAIKAGHPVEAVPTAVNGRAEVGDFAGHPNAAAIDALIVAKNTPKPKHGSTTAAAALDAATDRAAAIATAATAAEPKPEPDHDRRPDWTRQGMTAAEWNAAGRPNWATNNPAAAAAAAAALALDAIDAEPKPETGAFFDGLDAAVDRFDAAVEGTQAEPAATASPIRHHRHGTPHAEVERRRRRNRAARRSRRINRNR